MCVCIHTQAYTCTSSLSLARALSLSLSHTHTHTTHTHTCTRTHAHSTKLTLSIRHSTINTFMHKPSTPQQPHPQTHLLDCPWKVAGLWDYPPERQFFSSCPSSSRLGTTLPSHHKTACLRGKKMQVKELMKKKRWIWTLPDVKSCLTRMGRENWTVLLSTAFPCPVWK